MDEKQLKLLVDLHKGEMRQGPGGEAETKLAMSLAGLNQSKRLRIADIGCGTGASSIQLARALDADVVAVDFLDEFLEVLRERAAAEGVADRIDTLNCSMEDLPFEDEGFDVIWSEGAIYNMGFENGVKAWKKFLKPGGVMVVSEITWLTDKRPDELQQYWEAAYPEIGTASEKIGILEKAGYVLRGYFSLQPHCWNDSYYGPIQERFGSFMEEQGHGKDAMEIVEMEREEIALYEKYCAYYSYGVYVADKV